MLWIPAVVDGLVFGVLFNVGVLALMRRHPRGMAHMLPPSFRADPRNSSKAEIAAFYRWYAGLLVGLAILLVAEGWRIYRGQPVGFWGLFWHGYVVAMAMNLGDGIFLDLVEIPRHKDFYAREFGVKPQRLSAPFMLRNLTWLEHGVAWPLLVCPLVGLGFAGLVGLLI